MSKGHVTARRYFKMKVKTGRLVGDGKGAGGRGQCGSQNEGRNWKRSL